MTPPPELQKLAQETAWRVCNRMGLSYGQLQGPLPDQVQSDILTALQSAVASEREKRDEHIVENFKAYAYSVEYAKQRNHEFMTRTEAECNAENTVQRFRLMLHDYDKGLKARKP